MLIRSSLLTALLAIAALTAFGCSSGSSSIGHGCTSHDECPGGGCVAGTCVTQQCQTLADCVAENTICLASGVCTEAECTTDGTKACPEGKVCKEDTGAGGVCVTETPADRDATSSDAVATDAPASKCAAPCGPGTVCDETTGACVPDSVDFLCTDCDNNDQCGGAADMCSPLSSGSHCTKACTAQTDCPVGYTCYEVTNEAKQCVPNAYKCAGCITTGCPEGKLCHFGTGECQDPKPVCGTCSFDFECSSDGSFLCFKKGAGVNFCAPACGDGDTCSKGSTCATMDTGRKVCAFESTSCCYGPNCDSCDQCGGSTPHCKDGQCVQCLSDEDCPDEPAGNSCDQATGQCATSCPQDKPYLFQGQCVQCLNTSHCQSGNCNLATHTCAGDACSVCADPYPACVEIGGQFTCVQCTPPKDGDPGNFAYCEDKGADCVNQACCDANTYTCLGITQVVGTCKTDADCPGTSTSGGTLKCDTASQACYDPDGFCDGVMSQCPSGNCISLLDSMMGGGGGIPGMPGGGMPGGPGIPGFCGCTVGGTDCTPGSTCVDLASTQLGQMLPMFTDPVCINCDGVSKMFGGGMISMLCTLIVAGGGGGIPLPGFP